MKSSTLGDQMFISLLIQHEEAMAQLYGVLSDKVTCSSSFWADMQRQELSHARQLRKLEAEIRAGAAYLSKSRHPSSKIKTSLDSLLPRTRTWDSWGVDKRDAFEYALLLENSFIEKSFFLPVDGDSKIAIEVLHLMETDTTKHIANLETEYHKNVVGAGVVQYLLANTKSLFTRS